MIKLNATFISYEISNFIVLIGILISFELFYNTFLLRFIASGNSLAIFLVVLYALFTLTFTIKLLAQSYLFIKNAHFANEQQVHSFNKSYPFVFIKNLLLLNGLLPIPLLFFNELSLEAILVISIISIVTAIIVGFSLMTEYGDYKFFKEITLEGNLFFTLLNISRLILFCVVPFLFLPIPFWGAFLIAA